MKDAGDMSERRRGTRQSTVRSPRESTEDENGKSGVLGDRAEKLYYRRTHHAGDARGCRRLSQNELERTDCPKVTRGRPQGEEGDHSREMTHRA